MIFDYVVTFLGLAYWTINLNGKKKKKEGKENIGARGCLYVRNNIIQQIGYSYRDCPLTWKRTGAVIND